MTKKRGRPVLTGSKRKGRPPYGKGVLSPYLLRPPPLEWEPELPCEDEPELRLGADFADELPRGETRAEDPPDRGDG